MSTWSRSCRLAGRVGQLQGERGAPLGTIGGQHATAMQLGDAIHDRQAQPGAVVFRREERLEDVSQHFIAETRAAVGHFQLQTMNADVRGDHQASALRAWPRRR